MYTEENLNINLNPILVGCSATKSCESFSSNIQFIDNIVLKLLGEKYDLEVTLNA